MSTQAIFNNEAIKLLPRIDFLISFAIENNDFFEANQMKCNTLQMILNCRPAVANMNSEQIEALENELIEIFKLREWISSDSLVTKNK